MSKLCSTSQRPYKVWSSDRQKRKSITAANLSEFKTRAAEKLGYEEYTRVRVVLESDGTEVEDDCYFQSAEKDTVFLLLRDSECWQPPGLDAFKAALCAIPQIVCDTINSMKLANKAPTWSIKDEQGFITITLQWEQDIDRYRYTASDFDEPSWKLPSSHKYAQYSDKVYSSTFPRPSSSRSKMEQYIRAASRNLDQAELYKSTTTLPYKTLSADDFSLIDRIDDFSSAHDLTSYCDFHCSSLHREGGSIKVSKSVATSPIPEIIRPVSPGSMLLTASAAATTGTKAKKGHVRFMDIDKTSADSANNKFNISLMELINGGATAAATTNGSGSNSDESETETTERDEQYCERYLLLMDQLSANQKRHLSVKDIGIILERLKSKIVDIDKLERDKENLTAGHNWIIKATIRGEMLREIGVVYNGQYYALMEHPAYF